MRTKYFSLFSLVFLLFFPSQPKPDITFNRYHQGAEVARFLRTVVKRYPDIARLHIIGKSFKGKKILVMELAGKGTFPPKERPAIFVGANLEGVHQIGTEAALFLIDYLVKNREKPEVAKLLAKRTFYIAPLLNPDVAECFFKIPREERRWNFHPVDDDHDGDIDEDPPEDINGDGFITMMRVKDPEGKWIPDPTDPRLMKLADPMKGERGIYKLYTEGVDNDGDGKINEDPIGGVALNSNLPHAWEPFKPGVGLWPVSEPETIALVNFLVKHRNITLIYNFSTVNNLLNMKTPGKTKVGAEKVKVPERYASMIGLDPEKEYTLKEIVAAVKQLPMVRGMEIDETMVASFLGLGPVMTIAPEDLRYYQKVAEWYKKMLEETKIDNPDRPAKPMAEGDFTAWGYFQYGVPSFTVDIFAIPKEQKKEGKKGELTVEKLSKMSSEEFLALGPEKIGAFLKSIDAPPMMKPEMVINMVKMGRITPKQMAEMIKKQGMGRKKKKTEAKEGYILKWIDKELGGKGFIPWKPFHHPTLGEVEIGGFVPYVKIDPPERLIEKLISPNATFILKIAEKLPEVKIAEVKVEKKGKSIYQLTAYIRNEGYFPTAFRQGVRAKAVYPIFVSLELSKGQKLLAGDKSSRISSLAGAGGFRKYKWLIKGKEGGTITLKVKSEKAGRDIKRITLR
ncbi:MAG: hypothetical protein J7L64_03340 [Acidobacteria bacterium]|nr:hypothetical protein [Acidobacteriota bacterium]